MRIFAPVAELQPKVDSLVDQFIFSLWNNPPFHNAPLVAEDMKEQIKAVVLDELIRNWKMPTGTDYENWKPRVRLEINLFCLRILQLAKKNPRLPIDDQTRQLLQAYSGWGGIDIRDIAPDSSLFTPAQLHDLELMKEGKPAKTAFWRGLLYQYFTPPRVAEEMWQCVDVVRQELQIPATRTLHCVEPSAGIGRFVAAATGPNRKQWTLIDLDPTLTALLKLLYPQQTIVESSVEAWAKDVRGKHVYDALLANPPYTNRGLEREADPLGFDWKDGAAYQLWLGGLILRPGGIMCQLTTWDVMVSKQGEMRKLREYLLKHFHLVSIVLPPGDMFARVGAKTGLAITWWVQRAVPLDAVLPEDQEFLEGIKIDQPAAEGDKTWMVPYATHPIGYGERYRVTVQGTLQPGDIVAAFHANRRPIPAECIEAAAQVIAPPEAAPVEVVQAPKTLLEEAITLAQRVESWLKLARTDAIAAETGREELVADCRVFMQANPGWERESDVRKNRDRREVQLALGYLGGGQLPHDLITPVAAGKADDYEGHTFDPAEIVRWYSIRQGFAARWQIQAHYKGSTDFHTILIHAAGICLEPVSPPALWQYYDDHAFYTGQLWPRYDACVEWLKNNPDALPALREKMQRQIDQLYTTIDPQSLDMLCLDNNSPIQLRSGWVPPQCVRDFLRDKFVDPTMQVQRQVGGRWVLLDTVASKKIEERKDTYSQKTKSREPKAGEMSPYFKAQGIISYLNRENVVIEEEKVNLAHTNAKADRIVRARRHGSAKLLERFNNDAMLETEFRSWLIDSEQWGPIVENNYNRMNKGLKNREEGLDLPVSIVRKNADIQFRWMQNQAIRKGDQLGRLLIAHTVGLGKTFTGAGLIAYLRQQGKARRPLVLSPKSLCLNWQSEFKRLLPDFRVLVIGLERKADGHWVEVGRERKIEQWYAYQRGGYDVAITSYDTFQMVEVSAATRLDILNQYLWLQHEKVQDDVEADLVRKELKFAEEELAKAQRSDIIGDVDDPKETREKHVEAALRRVNRLKEQIKKATPRELEQARLEAEEQMMKTRFQHQREALNWESLGIDCLVVDEAHNFKNLWTAEQRNGAAIVGMGAGADSDAKRAWDLFVKTQELLRRTNKQGVYLLTGTPVINSPLELYTMIGYLGMDIWEARGIRHKEQFIDTFIRIENKFGTTADGGHGTRPTVAGSKNEVDFTAVTGRYIDFVTAGDANAWGRRHLLSALQAAPTLPSELQERITHWQQDDELGSNWAFLDWIAELKAEWTDQPELHALVDHYADVIPIPKMDVVTHMVQPDAIQSSFMQKVFKLAEATKKEIDELWKKLKNIDPKNPEANAIRQRLMILMKLLHYIVMDRGIKCALDPRLLIGFELPALEAELADAGDDDAVSLKDKKEELKMLVVTEEDFPDDYIPPKYRALAEAITKAGASCGHLVFLDSNVLHNEVRRVLAQLTKIPIQRIACLQGAGGLNEKRKGWKPKEKGPSWAFDSIERNALAEEFNGVRFVDGNEMRFTPKYDVLICQTRVAGEGMNLQSRTCAIHHLDFPWSPGILAQRNGRGVRQGNEFMTVAVNYFATDRSMDLYRLQLIWIKADWQTALLRSKAVSNANNPMAGLDIDPWLALAQAAADPAKARAEMLKAKELAEEKDRLRQQLVNWRLFKAAYRQSTLIPYETNPAKKKSLTRQFNAVVRQLKQQSVNAFSGHALLPELRLGHVFFPLADTILEPGRFYALGSGENQQFCAVDAVDGQQKWVSIQFDTQVGVTERYVSAAQEQKAAESMGHKPTSEEVAQQARQLVVKTKKKPTEGEEKEEPPDPELLDLQAEVASIQPPQYQQLFGYYTLFDSVAEVEPSVFFVALRANVGKRSYYGRITEENMKDRLITEAKPEYGRSAWENRRRAVSLFTQRAFFAILNQGAANAIVAGGGKFDPAIRWRVTGKGYRSLEPRIYDAITVGDVLLEFIRGPELTPLFPWHAEHAQYLLAAAKRGRVLRISSDKNGYYAFVEKDDPIAYCFRNARYTSQLKQLDSGSIPPELLWEPADR